MLSMPCLPDKNTDPRIFHAQAIKYPYTHSSFFNRLITLYSNSSNSLALSYANRLFFQLSPTNVSSWTSIISANTNSFLSLHYFLSMLRQPVFPTQRTIASLFKACTNLSAFSFGVALHSLALKLSLNTQLFAGSALVNFYAQNRLPENAHKVFDEMGERDEFCYSTLIIGLAQNGRPVAALSAFAEMKLCNVESTKYSVSGALRAVAEIAVLEHCRVIHGHSLVTGLNRNVIVGSGLIHGYGKAGLVVDARMVFDELLPELNLVGWNSMMAIYAQQGDKDSVLELYNSIESNGLVPDDYSFLTILTAFCNTGSVLEIEQWLQRMKVEYKIEPRLEHYTCLVRAMALAGRLEEAEQIAIAMPFKPDAAVWRAVLSSCAAHVEVEKFWMLARRLMELDPHDSSTFVIAANILSVKGRWDEVAEVRKLMKDSRTKKLAGKSWLEVKGEIHTFLSEDRRHERTEEIYAKLTELTKQIEKSGYAPVWDEMLHDV